MKIDLIELHSINYALSTQKMYQRILKEFFSVVKKDYESVTAEDLWIYVKYLHGKTGAKARHSEDTSFSKVTVYKNMNCIKSYFRFLHDGRYISTNPCDRFKLGINPKRIPQKRPTQAVRFEDVNKLINLPFETSREGIRDKAVLVIFFASGIRRAEATGLTLSDFCKSQHGTYYLNIRKAKGGKTRQQALPLWAIQPIFNLIELRTYEQAKENDPLIIGYGVFGQPINRHLTCKSIAQLFKRYYKKLGLKHLTVHSARATVATKLLTDGCNYDQVRDVLGHSGVQMVEVYDKRIKTVDNSVAKNLKYN